MSKTKNYRECSHCHEILPVTSFHKSCTSNDGLHYICKSCVKELNQLSRQRRLIEKPFYGMWLRVMEACYKIANYENIGPSLQRTWSNYGGRGITVSEEFHNYEAFRDYIVELHEQAIALYGPNVDLWIDRIDVNGHYERGNLRFVSAIESGMNRRKSQVDEYEHVGPNGRMTLPLTWWCRIYGQEFGSVLNRMKRGWSIARALNEPVDKKYTSNKDKPQVRTDDVIERVNDNWLLNDELIPFTHLCASYKLN
jgi:hypothetical protein